ncbi:MAG: EAL domain-containing protein [Eubacteriales bacterium]|nr:EAL domain-containing protein [Eubacteriales bacterium]
MEKLLLKEFKAGKMMRMMLLGGAVLFVFLTTQVFGTLYNSVQENVRQQAIDSVTNISELNAESIKQTIEERQNLIEALAIQLGDRPHSERQVYLDQMKVYAEIYRFRRLGLLFREDDKLMLYMTNGGTVDATGSYPYEQAWGANPFLSESYFPLEGGTYTVNMFSYPVIKHGPQGEQRIHCVVVGLVPSWQMASRMNVSSIKGDSRTFLMNSSGRAVVRPRLYEDIGYKAMNDFIATEPTIHPRDQRDGYFDYDSQTWYVYYVPLELNDWFLMTCVPERSVFASADIILHRVLVGMGILWIMAAAGMLAISFVMYRSQRMLIRTSFYDELTGIGTGSVLPILLRTMRKAEYDKIYVVIFDVDKFKEFNYIYGEEQGDELLRYIVHATQQALPDEYLFRYLSDYFVILLHADDDDEVRRKMDRLVARFVQDAENGITPPFDISAGIQKPQPGVSLRRTIGDALTARRMVKGLQVQQYAFYDEDVREKRVNDLEMESDFSRALRENEFRVYYQPKYDMSSGHIIGAEALTRWVKQDGTIISPGAFIPCFEATRQIIRLDEAVLEQVCRDMKSMEDEGLPVKPVAVNLSRVHLRHHGILDKIETIIRESGVDPRKLSFEITESALYEDSQRLKKIVDALHDMGCTVDMDDYGVGMSSANALAANRFDMVKLDKSFVDDISDQRMAEVIRSTISLSKALGMEILAEGVEQKSQADTLVDWGCTRAQGFYYSPPVTAEKYRALLRAEKSDDAPNA